MRPSEQRHDNLKRTMETLGERGVIGTFAMREFNHNGNTYIEYLLCKRDSLILVAQNCPEYTARIVDRWQELEEQVAKPSQMAILSATAALLLLEHPDKAHHSRGITNKFLDTKELTWGQGGRMYNPFS